MSTKQAVRQNFEEKASYVAKTLAGMTVMDAGSFLRVDCGVPSDTFNVVVARNLSNTDQLLHEGMDYFTAKQFPAALWYWEEAADQAGMAALLAHGLTHNETDVAMVGDLKNVNFNTAQPEGLTVKWVENEDELRQYSSVIVRLFGDSGEGQGVAAYFDRLCQVTLTPFPAMRYSIGIYQGAVVATGTLFIGSETVGIYDIVTQDEVRRRGIGSAMFATLLREAKGYSHRYAVLQASPDGVGIYTRAGFVAVGAVHVFENRSALYW